jgi:hypothetical protein
MDLFDKPWYGNALTNDLGETIGFMLAETIQFVLGAFSPLLDWKGDIPADSARQAWFEKIPSSLGVARSIHQPKERKSII